MSQHTIRIALDLLCDVINANTMLDDAPPNEIKSRKRKRDKKRQALRKIVAAFTTADIAHLQRTAPDTLQRLRALT